MQPVRFGILACSSVARRRFAPALARTDVARLERVASRDPARAADFAREFGCAKSGTYEALLDDPEVEIVYISTPPSLHEEWVHKAAAAGKHIWCEKPAFPDHAAALKAVERCRQAGVRLVEGYAFKHHPQHALVRSLITQNKIGTPRYFHGEFTYPRPPAGDIRLDPQLLGGVLHDAAGYPVSAAMIQMPGRPEAVFCQLGMDRASGVDDSFCLWMRFEGGAMAQMHVGFGTQYRSRYSILGERGRIELQRAFAVQPDKPTTLLLETNTGEQTLNVEPADQFGLMIAHVAAALRNPAIAADYETDLLRQQVVMDAAARSSHEARLVTLSVSL
jgi:dTDP-3,4-didehydro-2,6-dideoxy-alpha-D-glucose 3-reductase